MFFSGMLETAPERLSDLAELPPPLSPEIPEESLVSTVGKEDAAAFASLFATLADPTRLALLNILSLHKDGVCVKALVEHFQLSQSTISHHLRMLRKTGLVECTKKKHYRYYSVRHDIYNRAQPFLGNLVSSVPLKP